MLNLNTEKHNGEEKSVHYVNNMKKMLKYCKNNT